MTSYPSIDKPWLKYYSEEANNLEIPDSTLYRSIYNCNKDRLGSTAFRYYGRKITYGQFLASIEPTAKAIASLGVGKGDIITVMSMHIPEAISLLYAASYIGAIANFVYPTLSTEELMKVLQETKSKAFFVMDTFAADHLKAAECCSVVCMRVCESFPAALKLAYNLKNRNHLGNVVNFQDLVYSSKNVSIAEATDGNVPCVMVYTSGTTGQPKGVVLSSNNLNAVAAEMKASGKNYLCGETSLLFLPPFIGFGLGMLHLVLCAGLDTTLHIELEHEKIMKQFNRLKPNRVVGGPVLIDPFLQNAKGSLKNLIDFSGGGGGVPIEKEREVNAFLHSKGSKAKYAQGYGMTEFGSVVTLNQNHIYKEGSIGIPLPAVNVRIMDWEQEAECPYRKIGELCINTPSGMLGYYNLQEETEKLFFCDGQGQRWMRTGDLCEMDEDGFLFLRGRLKRIYVTMIPEDGAVHKLFPQRIEDVLTNLPGVESCGVIVYEHPVRIHAPRAFVKMKSECDSDATEKLEELAKKHLPSQYFPMEIIPISNMPATAGGKIDYAALGKMYEDMKK